jgi:hypothetical protein
MLANPIGGVQQPYYRTYEIPKARGKNVFNEGV